MGSHVGYYGVPPGTSHSIPSAILECRSEKLVASCKPRTFTIGTIEGRKKGEASMPLFTFSPDPCYPTLPSGAVAPDRPQ